MIINFVLVSGVEQGDLVIHIHVPILFQILFPFRFGSSDGKESTCNAGDLAPITGSGRSSGERNGYLLQDSCLENSTDTGDEWATAHGVSKSQT